MDSDSALLELLAQVARQAASAGGKRLQAMRERFSVQAKGDFDFVTDADIASQRAIESVVLDRFPEHAFFGEESDTHTLPPDDVICWVVDPLDGTTNFLHQFPCYCVSVAATKAGRVLAASIYDPLNDQHYWAAEGAGAWLDDHRIRVSTAECLTDSLLAMSLPPNVQRDSLDLIDFINVAQRCQAIRRTGSAAMNLAHLAAGRTDGYWARQVHSWDVAAGVLLIREAGGVVTNSRGGPFDLWKADLAAGGTPEVHRELLAVLEKSGL